MKDPYYYSKKDLKEFPKIGKNAPELAEKFFDYYGLAMDEGKLSVREKSLIALAVATVQNCPYCIDSFTNKCLSIGVSSDEMMEAIHVGAAMTAGITLAHATQMQQISQKKEL